MNALLVLSIAGIAALFSGFSHNKKLTFIVGLLALAAAFTASMSDWNTAVRYYNDMLFVDNYAVAFTGVMTLIAFLIFALFVDYKESVEVPNAEIFALLFFSLAGGVILVSYSNLLMLFMGIEILSIPLYILAGSKRHTLTSNEAVVKYFLLGAFASAFLLFGIVLIYGVTASFHIDVIAAYIKNANGQTPTLLLAGMIMLIAGLGFKISAAPFHFWTPDVYQGSPTIATTFMSTVVKTAGVGAFFRLFAYAFPAITAEWIPTLAVLAALTMTVGNVTAVFQTSVKRMLAYSGIAHAGYLLIALVSLSSNPASSVLYYLIAYSVSTVCAFAVLMVIQHVSGSEEVDGFKGISKRSPFLAFITTVAFISIAGIPPTAGFFAKFYLFSGAVKAGHLWLTIIAVLNSCIGIYYYFRVITAVYSSGSDSTPVELGTVQKAVMIITALLAVALGLFPEMIISLL